MALTLTDMDRDMIVAALLTMPVVEPGAKAVWTPLPSAARCAKSFL